MERRFGIFQGDWLPEWDEDVHNTIYADIARLKLTAGDDVTTKASKVLRALDKIAHGKDGFAPDDPKPLWRPFTTAIETLRLAVRREMWDSVHWRGPA